MNQANNLFVGSYHSVSDISLLSDAENDDTNSFYSEVAGIKSKNDQITYTENKISKATANHSVKAKDCLSHSEDFEFVKPIDLPASLSYEKLDIKPVCIY